MKKIYLISAFTWCISASQVFGQLPAFGITRIDNSRFTEKDLPGNVPVLYMYFSPTCPHCQVMTSSILSHMKELKGLQVVMMTMEPMEEVHSFVTKFTLASYPNIAIGMEAYPYTFSQHFHFSQLPFLVLYDNQGNLLRAFNSTSREEDFIPDVVESLQRQ